MHYSLSSVIAIVYVCISFTYHAEAIPLSSPFFKSRGWIPLPSHINRKRIRSHLSSRWMQSSVINFPRGGSDVDVQQHDISDIKNEIDTRKLVIIIDVDNTLYSEQDLLSSTGQGIESQIIRNTHLFGQLHFNLTVDECNDLYKKYGSTIEGLRHTLPAHQVEETMARFYKEVYDPIDFSCLLGICNTRDDRVHPIDDEDTEIRSGYDHGNALHNRRAFAEFLQSLCQSHTVYLASNSPKAHIVRAIYSMGLGNVDFAGILSPDMDCNSDSNIARQASGLSDNNEVIYPTKSSPNQYYKYILNRHSPTHNRVILLDDSVYNLRQAESVGIEGIHINTDRSLEEGLGQALGHILPSNQYTFSDVDYLHAKNEIDMNSINPIVWDQLAQQLALRLMMEQKSHDGILRIADLGAGMLSMLELILVGGGQDDDRKKQSMLTLINKHIKSSGQKNDNSCTVTKLEYFAYESNLNLLQGCKERLHLMGFKEVQDMTTSHDGRITFIRAASDASSNDVEVLLHLYSRDFQAQQRTPHDLDLIIGCCFADLFEPNQLALSLQRFALGGVIGHPPLIYFPITFAGITQFRPAHPSFSSQGRHNQMIPSDTTAFRMYSESLTDHGHNLDPSRIVNAIKDHGGELILNGSSDWIIDPTSNGHLWETMMYFFGMAGAREMATYHLDAAGWINQSRQSPRTIVVSNVDLLFHMRTISSLHEKDEASASASIVQEIQFVAPYNVTTINKSWDTSNSKHLAPDQVEIESLCSLISSGTELKIFRGSFDTESALDVNIKGMADESMKYPLSYGYSLVGRIRRAGSDVDKSLVGRLVFTFSPHSTRAIVDRDAIQLVPEGISAEDAVFFPSVETALSLVHDANVRMGENVAIFGQGRVILIY